MTANHHPVIRGIRLCGDKSGTAVSGQSITCPHCRDILSTKAEKHEAEALRSSGAARRFFAADAARVRLMLAGVEA